jgi:leucyl/phenylalanyl-tRNA---protein transferase
MLPPSTCDWGFPEPHEWSKDDDVVAVGADLAPNTLLYAYSHGMFPMYLPHRHKDVGWWSPVARGVIPLDGLRVTRSMKQSARKFTVTFNQSFAEVMQQCASAHTEGQWITQEFIDAYCTLHALGHAHSVEVWNADNRLVGGLYGVRINNFFAGESMFHLERDASKVAVMHLVDAMNAAGMALLDTQWCTDHLATLGCIEVPRALYLELLAHAVAP